MTANQLLYYNSLFSWHFRDHIYMFKIITVVASFCILSSKHPFCRKAQDNLTNATSFGNNLERDTLVFLSFLTLRICDKESGGRGCHVIQKAKLGRYVFEYSLFRPKQFSCKLISNFLFKLITEEKRCSDRDSISQRPQVQQIRWSNCETVSTTATNQEGLQRKSSLWEKLKCAARGLFPAPNCKWPPKPLHRETALFLYTRRTTGGLAGWLAAVAHASLGGAARSPPPAPTLPVCGACGAGKTSPVPPRSQPRRSLRDSAVLGS